MGTSSKTLSPYTLNKKRVKPTVYLVYLLFTIAPTLLVYLLPITKSIPLDRILLPAFFAPLIALLLYKPRVAYVSAILGAAVIVLLAGNMSLNTGIILFYELPLFVFLAHQLYKNEILRWICAPLSMFGVKLITFVVMLIIPPLAPIYFTANSFLVDGLSNGVLGITLLMGVNVLVLKHIQRLNYYKY